MVFSFKSGLRQDARAVPRNQYGWRRYGIALALILPSFAASANPVAVTVVPHRAAYNITLISTDSSSGIADVTGGMTFEWADACEGWAIDQRYFLRIANDDGAETVIQSSAVNWESKDGLRFRFTTKHSRDGKVTEEYSGEARLPRDGAAGTATYTKPKAATVPLPAGTRFPTDLTLHLMRAGTRGERPDRGLVFEGADMEGAQPVVTTILPTRAARESSVLAPPLGLDSVWPMVIAYFQPGRGDSVPETEIALDQQANGIVPFFTLEYGDFKLRAVLARVGALPAAAC